eukprot:6491058-Amphidinium_carterae.2
MGAGKLNIEVKANVNGVMLRSQKGDCYNVIDAKMQGRQNLSLPTCGQDHRAEAPSDREAIHAGGGWSVTASSARGTPHYSMVPSPRKMDKKLGLMLRSLESEHSSLTFGHSKGLFIRHRPIVYHPKGLRGHTFCTNPTACSTQDLNVIRES